MPLFSFIKKLVGGGGDPNIEQQNAQQPHSEKVLVDSEQLQGSPNGIPDGNCGSSSSNGNELPSKSSLPPPPPMANRTNNSNTTLRQQGSMSPLPPPPPVGRFSCSTSNRSSASLRSEVERSLHVDSSTSIYTDFTGPGHAENGHWNDPPTVVFKPGGAKKKTCTGAHKDSAIDSETSSLMISEKVKAATPDTAGTSLQNDDSRVSTPGEPANTDDDNGDIGGDDVEIPVERKEKEEAAKRILRESVDRVSVESSTSMVKRMAEDTSKRLDLFEERVTSISDQLLDSIYRISKLIERKDLTAAANVHRDVMQAGNDSELRWLVGVKRVIELAQKPSQG